MLLQRGCTPHEEISRELGVPRNTDKDELMSTNGRLPVHTLAAVLLSNRVGREQ